MTIKRRKFIKTIATAVSAPFILPSHIWAADVKPNDRMTMGFIGMGLQNNNLMQGFLTMDTQVLAVCDVDTTRRDFSRNKVDEYYTAYPKKGAAGCTGYNDFRELIARDDIDAVCIATPDHWHTIPVLAAIRSGKDVYCEKPLTHNIHETIEVMKAVDKNKRVLQTGSMQRSSKEFRVCCELVRNGVIGKIEKVECSVGGPGRPYDLPEEKIEPGLDWEMWLGPAPKRPYNSILIPPGIPKTYPAWRKYEEFGGGQIADWGAHHFDIAQWGLDMDTSGPVEVHPPAKKGDDFGATMVYENGITVSHKSGFGIHFYGSEGEVQVNRGKFVFKLGDKVIAQFVDREDGSLGSQLVKAEREYLKDAKVKLYNSKNHLWDFKDAVISRKKPITHEGIGGRSAICCHLMNLVHKHNEVIKWNPKKMEFRAGSGKPEWLTNDYRAPWKV